jgi:hypothetical protein
LTQRSKGLFVVGGVSGEMFTPGENPARGLARQFSILPFPLSINSLPLQEIKKTT